MKNMSRRGFVSGLGLLGASAAALGAVGMAGCAAPAEEEGSGLAATGPDGAVPYRVHETDVVVVGGGLAGLSAARSALKSGARTVMVDKGRFGHSGDSGLNWGHQYAALDLQPLDGEEALGEAVFRSAFTGDGLVDQQLAFSIEKTFHDMQPSLMYEQIGGILERDLEGHPTFQSARSSTGFKPRVYAQHVKRMGLDIHDRTMALDILKDPDGRAAGVVALDLKTGEAAVFRAKAVVMAVGTFVWAFGWNGMRAETNGSPESTGEGYAMMMRAGVPMRDAEISESDQTQYTPLSTRNSTYAIGSQLTSWPTTYNNEGELVGGGYADHPEAMSQGSFMRLTLRDIYNGKGTEHGGVYRDTTGDLIEQVEYFWRRSKEDMFRDLGYEVPDMVEVTPHFWNTGMRPFDLSESCETVVPGLFYAGQGPYVFTGCSFNCSMATGHLAGAGAASYAGGDMPAIDRQTVADVLDRSFEYLGREGDGKRPFDVLRMIQDTMWEGCGLIRDEGGINATIAELERIRDEELPALRLGDASRCMNTDWQLALSLPGMIDCCLADANASLARKQSRGAAFCRTDFPELGDELYNTKTTVDGTTFTVETVPINGVVADEATLLEVLPRVSFANGFEY